MNRRQIQIDVVSSLTELYYRFNSKERSTWTLAIQQLFKELAARYGFEYYPNENHGEWLFDHIWCEMATETRMAENVSRTTSLILAMECEWTTTLGHIAEDFDKLLVCNAQIRVFICGSNERCPFQSIVSYCEDALNQFKGLAMGAEVLLCIMPETDGEDIVFRHLINSDSVS